MNSNLKRRNTTLRNKAPKQPATLPEEVRNYFNLHERRRQPLSSPLTRIWSCEQREMMIQSSMFGEIYYLVFGFAHLGHDIIYSRWFYTLEGLNGYASHIMTDFTILLTANDKTKIELIDRYKGIGQFDFESE